MIRYVAGIIAALFCCSLVYGEIRIYLHPSCERGMMMTLGDIATVEAPGALRNKLVSLIVPIDTCRDGYVDRDEIGGLVRSISDDMLFIFGDAVKIVMRPAASDRSISMTHTVDRRAAGKSAPVCLIRRGDPITIIIIKNALRLEVQGTAAQAGGAIGDTILVAIGGNKKIRCTVLDAKTVEVRL